MSGGAALGKPAVAGEAVMGSASSAEGTPPCGAPGSVACAVAVMAVCVHMYT